MSIKDLNNTTPILGGILLSDANGDQQSTILDRKFIGFQQNGNVVDVAVDRVNNLIWFRVDGGDWNGDNAQNPETTSGGIDISSIPGDAYPGACPYSYNGIFGQISINNSVSNPPSGFKVL